MNKRKDEQDDLTFTIFAIFALIGIVSVMITVINWINPPETFDLRLSKVEAIGNVTLNITGLGFGKYSISCRGTNGWGAVLDTKQTENGWEISCKQINPCDIVYTMHYHNAIGEHLMVNATQ